MSREGSTNKLAASAHSAARWGRAERALHRRLGRVRGRIGSTAGNQRPLRQDWL
eukprot:SAG31_NODE_1045_length_10180_cov_5.454221_13_plen_54_part_00